MKHKVILCAAFLLVSCSTASPPQPSALPLPSVEIATGESTRLALTPAEKVTAEPAQGTTSPEEATVEPTQAITPEIYLTMTAAIPAIEVTFDGDQCTTNASPALTLGEQLISFSNLSDQTAYMFLFRDYPGKTWQDVLLDIGTPGSDSEIPTWIAMAPYDHSLTIDSHLTYQQFTFQIEGEYGIVVETREVMEGTWPCGSFTVVPPP